MITNASISVYCSFNELNLPFIYAFIDPFQMDQAFQKNTTVFHQDINLQFELFII